VLRLNLVYPTELLLMGSGRNGLL